MVDLEDLKAKAMAADQGPHHIYTHPRDSNKHAENAVFHAACEPQIIIELIDRLQNAETELARLPAKWSEDSSLQTWFPITSEELESLRAENKALKAKIEAARKQEPAVLIEGKKIFWNPEYKGVHEGGFYASPVPAQQVEASADIPDFTEEELLRLTNLCRLGELVRVPGQQPGQCNCIRWKSKTVVFRAYVDQKTYDGFTPEVQKWYEPILTEQLIKGGENER